MVNNRPMRKRQSYYEKCQRRTPQQLTVDHAYNQVLHSILAGIILVCSIVGSLGIALAIATAQGPHPERVDAGLAITMYSAFALLISSCVQGWLAWQSAIIQQHLQTEPDAEPAPPARAIRPSSRPEHRSRQARLRIQARQTRHPLSSARNTSDRH